MATPTERVRVDPELPEQVFGYWFSARQVIPPRPVGPPTGAVLPKPGTTFRDRELLCLDLVPVENYWLVLSELGRYTYLHTTELLRNEKWYFVPVPETLGQWPVRFVASYAPSLPWVNLDQYGREVQARARQDAPAVQFRLQSRPIASVDFEIP